MRPEHSDNTYLQCLLLEVGFQDMKDEMRKRYEDFKMEQAKPLVERIDRHAIASGKPSILFVVLAVICALVAVILGHTQVHGGIWMNRNEPSTGLADWSEVILKIQQVEGSDRILTAMDSGQEPLMDVLMEVLMDDQKIRTETSEEAQIPDKPATRSAGTQTSDSTTIPDDGSSRNNQSLGNAEEPASSPSTGDPEIEPNLPVNIICCILGYSALSVLLAICGLVVWAVAVFLKVCSRVVATVWKCFSLFREPRRVNAYPGRPHGVADGGLGDLRGSPRGGAGRFGHFCSECHGLCTFVARAESAGGETRYGDHVHRILPASTFSSVFRVVPAFVAAPSSTRLLLIVRIHRKAQKLQSKKGSTHRKQIALNQRRGLPAHKRVAPPQPQLVFLRKRRSPWGTRGSRTSPVPLTPICRG
ncbi:unnamed protein product [Ectocarpus fasciculatus]